jgi:hypothetical protein
MTVQRPTPAVEGRMDDEEGSDNTPATMDGAVYGSIKLVPQAEQLKNSDAVIKLEGFGAASVVGDYACCLAGILNGDSPRFRRQFWEFPDRPDEWVFQQTTVDRTQHFGGRDGVIYFDEANGHLREHVEIRRERLHDSDRRGNAAWGNSRVALQRKQVRRQHGSDPPHRSQHCASTLVLLF